mmetsp:Transcript_7563/g.17992  ORF Transcript_7563/g.17992 Transcript_7563/m.17992 type:complete len:405 (+) Transcript_7563:499-1713(+)
MKIVASSASATATTHSWHQRATPYLHAAHALPRSPRTAVDGERTRAAAGGKAAAIPPSALPPWARAMCTVLWPLSHGCRHQAACAPDLSSAPAPNRCGRRGLMASAAAPKVGEGLLGRRGIMPIGFSDSHSLRSLKRSWRVRALKPSMEPHETSMQAKSRSASSGTKQTASATKKRSRCWRSQPGHRRSFTCEESVASRAVSKSNECICSKINSSTMHHSRLRNVGPAMMSSLRQPERKIGRQGRSPLFTRMQHLSIQMLGSQRLRSSNSARHACSTSHLAAGSSYQLCETNASIESSSAGTAMFVKRFEGTELVNTSASSNATETERRRRRPSAMASLGCAFPISAATPAAADTPCPRAASQACTRARARVLKAKTITGAHKNSRTTNPLNMYVVRHEGTTLA